MARNGYLILDSDLHMMEPDDLWAVAEVARPVSDKMQWRPGTAVVTDKPG